VSGCGPKSCSIAALHDLDHFSQRPRLSDHLARAICPSATEGMWVIWAGRLAGGSDASHLRGPTETGRDRGAN